MNRYTETAYFMQKDSRKFGTLYYLLYVCRQEETAEIECVSKRKISDANGYEISMNMMQIINYLL